MCLRRSMYDQGARRAALDSSPDDDPHELLTSVCILVHHRIRLSTLKTNSSRRSSSSRLARAHEQAGRGRAGRASKRRHRGHTVRTLLVCVAARCCLVVLPEVREFIRDTKCRTNTTRGGRRARHPKTTLPHRPPGPPAADRIVGGAPFLLL